MKTKDKLRSFMKFKLFICFAFIMITFLNSCQKQVIADGDKIVINTTTLYDTLKNYGELTEFVELLKIAQFYDGLSVSNSSKYTLFAPNNDAISMFLKSHYGDSIYKTSLIPRTTTDSLYIKGVLQYHILSSLVYTADFSQGDMVDSKKSAVYTLNERVLTTSFGAGGMNNIIINNRSKIIKRDIIVNNGSLNIIDRVLDFEKMETLGEMVKKDSTRYSIFLAALRKTTYFDSINYLKIVSKSEIKYSLLIETDSVFKSKGINNINDLMNLYSRDYTFADGRVFYKDPTKLDDSLNLFVSAHILKEQVNYSEMNKSKKGLVKSFNNQKITFDYDSITTTVLANVINNRGTIVSNIKNNILTKNGLIHELEDTLSIKKKKPSAFDYFFGDEYKTRPGFPKSYEGNTESAYDSLKTKYYIRSWTTNNTGVCRIYMDAGNLKNIQKFPFFQLWVNNPVKNNWFEYDLSQLPFEDDVEYYLWVHYRVSNANSPVICKITWNNVDLVYRDGQYEYEAAFKEKTAASNITYSLANGGFLMTLRVDGGNIPYKESSGTKIGCGFTPLNAIANSYNRARVGRVYPSKTGINKIRLTCVQEQPLWPLLYGFGFEPVVK